MTDEYGNQRAGSGEAVEGDLGYGWLGAKQRAHAGTTGLILMGVRVYNPVTGQFTAADPVFGGNVTEYKYPLDPVNSFDLDGRQVDHRAGGGGGRGRLGLSGKRSRGTKPAAVRTSSWGKAAVRGIARKLNKSEFKVDAVNRGRIVIKVSWRSKTGGRRFLKLDKPDIQRTHYHWSYGKIGANGRHRNSGHRRWWRKYVE